MDNLQGNNDDWTIPYYTDARPTTISGGPLFEYKITRDFDDHGTELCESTFIAGNQDIHIPDEWLRVRQLNALRVGQIIQLYGSNTRYRLKMRDNLNYWWIAEKVRNED